VIFATIAALLSGVVAILFCPSYEIRGNPKTGKQDFLRFSERNFGGALLVYNFVSIKWLWEWIHD